MRVRGSETGETFGSNGLSIVVKTIICYDARMLCKLGGHGKGSLQTPSAMH